MPKSFYLFNLNFPKKTYDNKLFHKKMKNRPLWSKFIFWLFFIQKSFAKVHFGHL